MFNQSFYNYGSSPNIMRQLFAYGLEQAKLVGEENVYDYSLGNPSVPAPKAVNEAIIKLVTETDSIKLHGYSMAAGFESARAAVAADLTKRFGIQVSTSELFFTCGAAPGLVAVIRALLVDENSEIMAIAPFFTEYRPFVEGNGGRFVMVPPDTDTFQIDFSALEALISENTQAIIINSPNNPSGVIYTESTLKKMGEILDCKAAEYGHPIYLIADEPYRELVYGGTAAPFIPSIYKNTIVTYSYSKSLSLPGERIGYIYVPAFADEGRELYTAIAGAARISGHVCPPTLFQKVVELCAEERPDIAAYDENRILLYNSLTEMGYECAKPEGAFYMFVKSPIEDAYAFSEKAKLDYNLLVVPADPFGCPGFLRLSTCVSGAMIKRSLPAFKAMIEAYK